MSYLGNSPTDQSFVATVDYFNGDGVTVAFTLSRQVASVAQVQAVIENVPQNPSSAFTLMGNVITFTSAPPSGSANIYVYYTSPNTKVMAPSASTVDTVALAAAAVTSVKMANSGYEFGMRNRIINGDMRIDQRNGGGPVACPAGTVQSFITDRFWAQRYNGTTGFTAQQMAAAPTGFINSLRFTTTTAGSSGATDTSFVAQRIEGLNTADLCWGTSSAQPVTLSFWTYSSLTGNFSGALTNNGSSRSYPFVYTINAANTWEQKTITIPGDTSGTWLTTIGNGVQLTFDLGCGSNYRGAANAWAGASYFGVTNAVSLVGTNAATLYITGIQLEKGTVATPFEYRHYSTELALCQRYCYLLASGTSVAFGMASYQSASYIEGTVSFPVTMRSTPVLTHTTGTDYYAIYVGNSFDYFNSFGIEYTSPTGTTMYCQSNLSGTIGQSGWLSTKNSNSRIIFEADL